MRSGLWVSPNNGFVVGKVSSIFSEPSESSSGGWPGPLLKPGNGQNPPVGREKEGPPFFCQVVQAPLQVIDKGNRSAEGSARAAMNQLPAGFRLALVHPLDDRGKVDPGPGGTVFLTTFGGKMRRETDLGFNGPRCLF